jgi:hypothetical protein
MRAQLHPRLLAQKLRAYATHLPRIEELAVRSSARESRASRVKRELAEDALANEPVMRIPA